MNEKGTTGGLYRMPLALRPWWTRQVVALPLVTEVPFRSTRQSGLASYLETEYEPGAGQGQEALTAASPGPPRAGRDWIGGESTNSVSAPTLERLGLTVSGWPQGPARLMGGLSLNHPRPRAGTGRLAVTPPPCLSGREHLGGDEELAYRIDLVR